MKCWTDERIDSIIREKPQIPPAINNRVPRENHHDSKRSGISQYCSRTNQAAIQILKLSAIKAIGDRRRRAARIRLHLQRLKLTWQFGDGIGGVDRSRRRKGLIRVCTDRQAIKVSFWSGEV